MKLAVIGCRDVGLVTDACFDAAGRSKKTSAKVPE